MAKLITTEYQKFLHSLGHMEQCKMVVMHIKCTVYNQRHGANGPKVH